MPDVHPELYGHFPFDPARDAQGEPYCASDTEMTGLIPGGCPDEDELDSYQDIFPYLADGSAPA